MAGLRPYTRPARSVSQGDILRRWGGLQYLTTLVKLLYGGAGVK
jgi:hypothetical protein